MFNSAARVSCLIPSISRTRFILCPWCVLLIGIVSVLIVVYIQLYGQIYEIIVYYGL